MPQLLTSILGVLTIVAVYRLGRLVFGEISGNGAAWVLAIFPTHVLYSTLVLRDAYSTLFLTLGLIYIIRLVYKKSSFNVLAGLFVFLCAATFHGANIIGIIIIMMIILSNSFQNILKLRINFGINYL